MKYVVLIGDGMADWPLDVLRGLTPLEKAHTPYMDMLASKGSVGSVNTIPEGFPPGSDVANLSIMGYDPARFYSGRAPLEAASMGLSLNENDVAFRCNIVCLDKGGNGDPVTMKDYSAGHITTEEARILITAVNEGLAEKSVTFYPGVSYRHLMLWNNGEVDVDCTPPHDIAGKDIAPYLPAGKGEELLKTLMKDSVALLESQDVNKERIKAGKLPGNSIWLWGQGKKPDLSLFSDKYGVSGSLISAVDLTKGLGIYAGLDIINVPGATGYIDTNYKGKAEYALASLKERDFVYIHVEAPDEAGHSGNLEDKIRAIEDFDKFVVGGVFEGLKAFGDFRVLLMPDHATPLEIKTHSSDPVPFAIYDSRKVQNKECAYNEHIVKREDAIHFRNGYEIMGFLINHK